MRKLAVSVFSTLDGVMQAPGGPEEDPTGGFTHGGWAVNYWDEMALLAAGLIDELRLWTFPLVLGHGKRLFGKGAVPAAFSVAHARSSTTDVLITTYRRAGAVGTGSFALRDPTEAELARRAKTAREG